MGCVCPAVLRVLIMVGGLGLGWHIDVLLAFVLVVKPCIRASITLHPHSMPTVLSLAMFFGHDRRLFLNINPSMHIPHTNPSLYIPSVKFSKVLLTIVVVALIDFLGGSLALALYRIDFNIRGLNLLLVGVAFTGPPGTVVEGAWLALFPVASLLLPQV